MPSQPAGEVSPAGDWTDAIYLSTDAVYSETGWIEWTPGYTHAGTCRIPVMLTATYDVQGRTSAVGAGDDMDVGEEQRREQLPEAQEQSRRPNWAWRAAWDDLRLVALLWNYVTDFNYQ